MGNWTSQRKREESTEGASTSSSISPEATGVDSGQYQVFLSFNGSDTRKEFTDHLYHCLTTAGIRVFKDDESIPIGERFDLRIINGITQSKISIPIISENYASSKWCLRELVHMMKRKESLSHTVLPIFYKVSPSNVRHLTGNFGKAFSSRPKHFDEKDIQEGRRALAEVGKLEGWESEKFANGHEGELIRCVVETVQSKLHQDFQLDIPEELVGLDDRLVNIMNWIRTPSVNARMIGIYGMGGIGKTTLAKCIYNQFLGEFEQFERASFLPNIREKATHQHGMEGLQSQLIYDILGSKIEVSRIDDGINLIKSRFKGKNVLIVLDDIDGKDQLDVLARNNDWFSAGSMIIVTTRNEAVLDQSKFEGVYKYEMKGLDEVQSLVLFNRHAFREGPYRRDLESISRGIISTMDGLPLALKVVGSYLYGKENKEVWEDLRRQLKSQPHKDVQKILRISYDALEDGHKQIFLDIACFFVGEYWKHAGKYMKCMWEDCGLYPSLGIEELKLRCLIKIRGQGHLEMHDQIRDLGRSIFCEGQPIEKRGGPWDDDYEGVSRVLRHRELRRRRLRDLMQAASSGEQDLSEVRWLEWRIDESDSSLSTANLHLPKLAVLDLGGSKITEDWEGWSSLRASTRLRALNLAECSNLRSTPDLSAFTQLKILGLYGRSELEHLHPSIGELKSLVSLELTYCRSLKELPEEVGELKELEELNLCFSGITQFPTSICSLGKLKELNAAHCYSLRGIPSSIGDLQNLQYLMIRSSLIEELPSSIGRLKNLQTLDIDHILISDLPESIRNLSSLQSLYLSDCDKLQSVPELPSSLEYLQVTGQLKLPQLSRLIYLERLDLGGCHLLEDIPDLPSRLWKLDGFEYLGSLSISRCSSIEILDLSGLVHLERLDAQVCDNLIEIHGLDNLEFLERVTIKNCNSIKWLLCPESRYLKELHVESCNNLVEVIGPLDSAKFLERLLIEDCRSLETFPDLTGCKKSKSLSTRGCEKLTQIQGLEKLD